MKKLLTIIYFLSVLTCSGDSWIQKASVGGSPRNDAVAFSIPSIGKGYVGTGTGIFYDFWEYNPVNNVWTQKANYPGLGNNGDMGFSIGSKGYICGGHIGNTSFIAQDLWEYDPSTNNWTQKANLPNGPRCYSFAFSIGSKGYVGSGWDSLWNPTADFWEYDATGNIWTQKANYAGGVTTRGVGISTSTKGYACMGFPTINFNFWEYNPITDQWTQKANVAGPMFADVVGFSICEKVYIGTGQSTNISGETNELWEYDPATNNWSQKANFIGSPRDEAVGFSLSGKGYLGTGNTGLTDWYEYQPDSCTTIGISQLTINKDLIISYPNPFNDKLNFQSLMNEKTELFLYDIFSKQILHRTFINSTVLYTKTLPKGIYFYELRSSDKNNKSVIKTGKVVKQ